MNRKITIACVQQFSEAGEIRKNLDAYEKRFSELIKSRARIVILPELFSAGYIPNTTALGFAEKEDGPTIEWMRAQSLKHKLYIGGGIAVKQGGECYNRYYVTDPDGNIAGYAQKKNAESYCFKRGEGIHIIKTDIAILGIAICADSHISDIINKLKNSDAEVLLLPHAWPIPKENSSLPESDIVKQNEELKNYSGIIGRLTGKPVVFCNQLGDMKPMQGIMGKLMKPENFHLNGHSSIADADGNIKASTRSQNSVITAEIEIGGNDLKNRDTPAIPDYFGYTTPGSILLRRIIMPVDIFMGQREYNRKKTDYL